jgi:hypothetical protein
MLYANLDDRVHRHRDTHEERAIKVGISADGEVLLGHHLVRVQ